MAMEATTKDMAVKIGPPKGMVCEHVMVSSPAETLWTGRPKSKPSADTAGPSNPTEDVSAIAIRVKRKVNTEEGDAVEQDAQGRGARRVKLTEKAAEAAQAKKTKKTASSATRKKPAANKKR